MQMTRLEQLEADKAQLMAQLQGLREAVQVEVDTDPDEGDPDLTEREKNLMLIVALEKELLSTESAIRALQKGTYGICERCGEQIPSERLEVRPEATHCVKCQAEVERLIRRGLMRATPTRRRVVDDDYGDY
jgi:RNA polymerase-binding protein DksA